MSNQFSFSTANKSDLKNTKKKQESYPQPVNEIDLVEEAFNRIKDIYFSHAQQVYQEVANYLIETFFNNDIDLVRKRSPAKDKINSFNKLIQRLKDEDARLPKRSWLYNAIGLHLDAHDLNDSDLVHTYGQLSVSHKVQLLAIRDLDQKKELIGEISEKGYSVRSLQKRITELKPKKPLSEIDYFLKQLEKIIGDLSKAKSKMADIFDPLPDRDDYAEMQSKLDDLIKEVSEELKQGKDEANEDLNNKQ